MMHGAPEYVTARPRTLTTCGLSMRAEMLASVREALAHCARVHVLRVHDLHGDVDAEDRVEGHVDAADGAFAEKRARGCVALLEEADRAAVTMVDARHTEG